MSEYDCATVHAQYSNLPDSHRTAMKISNRDIHVLDKVKEGLLRKHLLQVQYHKVRTAKTEENNIKQKYENSEKTNINTQ